MAKTERQKIIQKLDKTFSRYIRLRDSDDEGYGNCITSGKPVFWKNADCGHFQSRRFLATRWHEHNANMQSKGDNITGEQYLHGLAIDQKFGEGTADEMVRLSRQTTKYTIVDLREMLEYWERKLKALPNYYLIKA